MFGRIQAKTILILKCLLDTFPDVSIHTADHFHISSFKDIQINRGAPRYLISSCIISSLPNCFEIFSTSAPLARMSVEFGPGDTIKRWWMPGMANNFNNMLNPYTAPSSMVAQQRRCRTPARSPPDT